MTIAELQTVLDRFGLGQPSVRELFEHLREEMATEVAAVESERLAGGVFPEVAFDDIAAGRVRADKVERIRRRGVAVVRGTFDEAEATAWNDELGDYLATNRFEARFDERYPDAGPASRIFGVYWSRPQVEARQHPRMDGTRRFLNSVWRHESDETTWFDPDHDIGYPDRIRRRAPGVPAKGLRPHSDSVSTRGWRVEENLDVFHDVLAGRPDRYDPWDAAHRTSIDPSAENAPASVFRSFQGWTALSEMRPSDGTLHALPIPRAAAYLLVRGIAGELGLVDGAPEEAPPGFRADDVLMPALTPIPTVRPGDTVWWHGDLIHSVAPAANDTRWGNVMYIGSTPRCPRNEHYAASMLERFEAGLSPIDFPAEDFEVDFAGRATVADLSPLGRWQFGLEPIVRT